MNPDTNKLIAALKKPMFTIRPGLIVVEGLDGAGKTTAIKNIIEPYILSWLSTNKPGIGDIVKAYTPWDGVAGKEIRDLFLTNEFNSPKTEILLAYAARSLLVDKFKEFPLIIVDRYVASTFAYNSISFEDQMLWADLTKSVCGNVLPDLTIYLDVKPTTGLTRVNRRHSDIADIFEARDIDFFETCANRYELAFGFLEPFGGTYSQVNANQSIELVASEVEDILKIYLEKHFGATIINTSAAQ